MKLPVHRIIPFSNVEGIGNRCSIFLQGCNINCLYCHNPETIPIKSPQTTEYSLDELVAIIEKYSPFIRGITVSGGEPTLHAERLNALFRRVKKLGLTCYLDSNGFFDAEKIAPLIAQTDKFLFDIKGMGEGLKNLCFSNRFLANPWQHFENLEKLLVQDKVEEVRFVYMKGFCDEQELVRQIALRLRPYPQVLFKLIRVHLKGVRPDQGEMVDQQIPSPKEVNQLGRYAKKEGIEKVQIIL